MAHCGSSLLFLAVLSLHDVPPLCHDSTVKRRLAFIFGHLGERGTSVSSFDYAHFSETLLGIPRPLIVYDSVSPMNFNGTIRRYKQRFGRENVRGVCRWGHTERE